ncbi:MAG: ribulose-phosphate 3-epimerase [Bacteroidia bacterium]|nr:ribulose-phosphate 3-epimerase [Bacteroidia bacterium]
MKAPIISPSLLSADFGNLQRDIDMVNGSSADWFHVDIMDGVFVPNISFGFPVLNAIRKHATKPLDVHLMIADADKYLQAFRDAGAANLSVHIEACSHLHRTIQEIRSLGMKAGVAINPHTPVSSLESILSELDLVIVMSVNPGFGGQKFIDSTFKKVSVLREMIKVSGSKALIEVDGGVSLENAPLLLKAGADALVAGNTVFASADPVKTIGALKSS